MKKNVKKKTQSAKAISKVKRAKKTTPKKPALKARASKPIKRTSKKEVLINKSKQIIDMLMPEIAQQILERAQTISAQLKKKVNSK